MHKSLKSLSLSLLNTDYVELDNKWNYDNVISPFSRMYYIDAGHAKIYHSGQEFELKPGYLYLVPSYCYSRYKCDNYLSQYHITFMEKLGDGLSVYNHKAFNYEVKASAHDVVLFKRLLEINPNRGLFNPDPKVYDNHPTILSFERKNEEMNSSDFLETQGMLLSLFSRFITDKNIIPNNDSHTAKKITESVQFIHENLQQSLSVDLLASKSHLNVDYYSRAFNNLFGIRPIRYIQIKRIERAQLLLTSTTDTIPDIAMKIGISNLSYFNRLFKKITGKNPGEFRKYHWRM